MIPTKPSCQQFGYNPDFYCIYIMIAAGDNTHDGYNLYRDDGNGWEEFAHDIDTNGTHEYYLGSESDVTKPWKATTFNADGESEPVYFGSIPATPVTPIPANLVATRRATANSIPDAQFIDLSWDGELVAGDGWRVVLKDPNGYPSDIVQDTVENSLAIQIGQWIDRTIEVYPTATPANKATLLIPARPPARSTPTNLTATIATDGDLKVEFDSDWLWLSLHAVAEDNTHHQGIIWYALYDPATQTAQAAQSINPGYIETLTDTRFRLAQPLPPPDAGLQYQVTVEIGSDSGGFSEIVMQDKPDAILALPEGLNNELTSVVITKHDDYMENVRFDPFYLLLEWAFSDALNPRAIDIETKIDDSDWRYTGSTDDGSALLQYGLCGSRYSAIDQGGPLDAAHDYLFSDGTFNRDPQPLHTIHARARISGNTADQWIEAQQTFSIPLRSIYRNRVDWLYVSQRNNAEWNSPTVYGENPPGQEKRFTFTVDDSDNYSVINPRDWLYVVPKSLIDGQEHTVSFRTSFFTTATGELHHFIDDAPVVVLFPTRAALMPNAPTTVIPSFKKVKDPFTNLQTGYEFSARLQYDSAMLKAAVSVDSSPFSDITWTPITSYPPSVKLNDVVVPRDGLTHIVIFRLWHRDAVTNEDSELVVTDGIAATFDLAPPALPTSVSATLVRDGMEGFPDQVLVAWDSPDPVDIYVVDPTAKKRKVYSADAQESSVVIENSRKYGTQDGQPHEYRFGLAAFNRSVSSSTVYAAPLTITSGEPAVAALTPDEVAGTAEKLSQAQLIAALDADLSADSAVIAQVITATVHKIKDVLAKGGSVTLDNIGQFAAEWSAEKTTFRNGSYVTVPAARSASFIQSPGLSKGVKAGLVLSDIEAASLA